MPGKNPPGAQTALPIQAADIVRQAEAMDCAQRVRFAAGLLDLAGAVLFAAAQVMHGAHMRSTPREFARAVEATPMRKRTAERLLSLHSRYADLPAAHSLAHLGMGKLEVLAALGDEEIETLATGGEVRGMDLDHVERTSNRQLELDLSFGHSSRDQEADDWKRRYERQARELRELRADRDDHEGDFQRRCANALASIQAGVDELAELAQEADLDARGACRLNGSVQLLAGTVKRAGTLLQHRFGAAKNRLARLAKNGNGDPAP